MHSPASGYRSSQSGDPINGSSHGCSWSSSAKSTTDENGANLNFHSDIVNPEGGSYRALGFPVRCVQE